jgi:hypothetical protein
MNAQVVTREQEVLSELRTRYESQGYEFISEPKGKDLPAFLEGNSPDAIASSAKEKVVIEIKVSTSSAKDNALAKFFATEIPKHPGWKFELIVAEKQGGGADKDAEPSLRGLRDELGKVQELVSEGDGKLALVTGWALLEALTRRLARPELSDSPKRYLPKSVIEILASDGFIDDSETLALSKLVVSRNRLVHGFSNIEVGAAEVSNLISILERLVDEALK